MVSRDELDRSTCVARVLVCALAISLVGCASAPGTGQAPRTPYKGDAVYNIASAGPSRDRDATTSHDPSVG